MKNAAQMTDAVASGLEVLHQGAIEVDQDDESETPSPVLGVLEAMQSVVSTYGLSEVLEALRDAADCAAAIEENEAYEGVLRTLSSHLSNACKVAK